MTETSVTASATVVVLVGARARHCSTMALIIVPTYFLVSFLPQVCLLLIGTLADDIKDAFLQGNIQAASAARNFVDAMVPFYGVVVYGHFCGPAFGAFPLPDNDQESQKEQTLFKYMNTDDRDKLVKRQSALAEMKLQLEEEYETSVRDCRTALSLPVTVRVARTR